MGKAEYTVLGYALVSDDDRIEKGCGVPSAADSPGAAERAYFDEEFDRAELILLDAEAHRLLANPRHRRRLIVSHTARGIEQRPDGWWWNPEAKSLSDALERAAPGGGRIAVAGGQGAYDAVLTNGGFDAFHLARMLGVEMPEGIPLFRATARGEVAESVLAGSGMRAGSTVTIDARGPVQLTVWRRTR